MMWIRVGLEGDVRCVCRNLECILNKGLIRIVDELDKGCEESI